MEYHDLIGRGCPEGVQRGVMRPLQKGIRLIDRAYFLQMDGWNSARMGNNSSLPASISRDSTILAKGP